MGQPYVGEIRLFAGTFAPAGWMDCSGQLLPISEYETLFQLIGTTYGGDGESTFGLPNMSGRVPLHMGTGAAGTSYQIGESGGVEDVILNTQQMAGHSHAAATAATGQVASPANAILANAQSTQTGVRIYSTTTATTTNLHPQSIGFQGGSQPHENMQPYLVVRYIISLFGIFPSQT